MKIIDFIRGRTFYERKERSGILFVSIAFIYFVTIYYYPLIQSFLFSFFTGPPSQNRKYVGLATYKKVLSDPLFLLSVKNTFYFVILAVPTTIVLALIIATFLNYVLNKKLRDILSFMFFSPLMISFVAAALIWEWIYHPIYGLLNNLFLFIGLPSQGWLSNVSQAMPSIAIMQIWLRLGFDIMIFLSALQAIPGEYYEAASIDGASGFSCFKHITLPLLNPQIVFVSIIELIFGFQVFDLVYTATHGGPTNVTRVIILHLYETAFKWYRFGEASVIAVFFFLFLLSISILQWKFRRTTTY